MEVLYWEDLKEVFHQHIRRYVSCLMYEVERSHLARLFQSHPLLMERWEGSYMDLFTNLSTIYGKYYVLILIDQLKMYVHSFTIHLQQFFPQKSKPLFRFHGPFVTTFSDGINHFLGDSGQDLFFLGHIQSTSNALYYFHDFENIMEEIKCLDGHLSYHVWRQQEVEQRWSHLRDYFQHLVYHVRLSPCLFWSPYGDDTLFTICRKDRARNISRTKEWDQRFQVFFGFMSTISR